MVKYRLTYKDVIGNDYICNIYSDGYDGDVIEVQGNCTLDYPKIDNIYQVIRGSGMRVELEASTDLTLEDLYANGEKENAVTLTRNGSVIFRGFIDPAGLYEDLVEDKWVVTLDCVDGLALLEDLSYVNSEGAPYTGTLSDIQTITNCLKRTGLKQEDSSELFVTTSINTRHETKVLTDDPLFTTYSNQERFYKDDGETIMSCKEVLESTLRKYGGCIIQVNGNWSIFSFYELLANDRLFSTYKDGVFISSEITNYESQDIVTFNGFNPDAVHWCNGNQRKEITPPVGAVKVNYKYGFVKTLIINPTFVHDGTSIENWTILESNGLGLVSGGEFITISSFVSGGQIESMLVADAFDVSVGDVLSINFRYKINLTGSSTNLETRVFLLFEVKITDGVNDYWLDSNGNWSDSYKYFQSVFDDFRNIDVKYYSFETKTESLPISGKIYLTVLRPYLIVDGDWTFTLEEAKIAAAQSDNIQGETHTQQIEGRNTRVEDVIEVNVGDNPSDIYNGALYKADGITNTAAWATTYMPIGFLNRQSILEILSEQIARYKKEPTYFVSGDVFGYFNPLKLLNLDLVNGRIFMMASYSLNTKTNVNSCEFMELRDGNNTGLTYEFAYDYGNVQKPTIIG